MTIAAGAIERASDGSAVDGFHRHVQRRPAAANRRRFDDAGVRLVGRGADDVADGRNSTRPMPPAASAHSNLTLSEGTVTGFTLVNSTTVTYSLSGLTSSGTLTVTIAAGAITDTNGGGGAAFTATYILTHRNRQRAAGRLVGL